ncbi:MAG: helix-turn-helix transcriptional regulator [Bacillota bacterium]
MKKEHTGDPHAGPLPERLLQAHLLLLLAENPAHGYELIQRLNEADFANGEADVATVYRHLRRMDQEGLLASRWEAGAAGPARRLYTLTPRGREVLDAWAASVQEQKEKLESFLRRYGAHKKGGEARETGRGGD